MIRIDPRFGSERKGQRSSHRAVAEALVSLGVETQTTDQLAFGDFAFLGNGPDGPIHVGIELKVVNDLVTSMRSGRLAEQVLGMSETYGRSYLIVEGFYRARRGSGLLEVPRGGGWCPPHVGPRPVFWADVEKFITGIEEAGVRVRRTRTSNETARVIAHVLQSFWNKDYDDHKSLHVLHAPAAPMALVREDPRVTRVRKAAMSLDVGIGWGRSKAVAERFGSILGLAEADAGEWEEIEGIGKTIARDAYKAIRAAQVQSGSKSTQSPPSRVSARVVSQKRSAPFRSSRHSRQRQNARLDPSGSAERRVLKNRAGRRGAR